MTALLLAAAIAAMGDEEYAVREWGSRAAAPLVRRDPARWGQHVAEAAASSPCAEVRGRANRLCGPWRIHVSETYTPASVPVWPEIDCASWAGVLDSCEAGRWLELARCENRPGAIAEGPYWHHYRRGMELFTRFKIRCGNWSTDEADRMLAIAWKAELEYFKARPELERIVKTWAKWDRGYPLK